ncbi:MAG: 50S ribosomal protein L29 [Candidatus Kerfeldbacteria bacterium]|nr:50S ribosomal protein L29 [Candidatus Kerfeldbacteria bacterium]
MMIKELRDKPVAELQKLLTETKTELAAFRMQVLSNKAKQVSKVQQLRRDVARILTVLNDNNRHD